MFYYYLNVPLRFSKIVIFGGFILIRKRFCTDQNLTMTGIFDSVILRFCEISKHQSPDRKFAKVISLGQVGSRKFHSTTQIGTCTISGIPLLCNKFFMMKNPFEMDDPSFFGGKIFTKVFFALIDG